MLHQIDSPDTQPVSQQKETSRALEVHMCTFLLYCFHDFFFRSRALFWLFAAQINLDISRQVMSLPRRPQQEVYYAPGQLKSSYVLYINDVNDGQLFARCRC